MSLNLTKVYTAPPPPSGTCTTGVQVPWPHEGLHSTTTIRYLHNWSPGPLTSRRSTQHHHHHQVPAQQESRSLDLTKVYTAPPPSGTCTTGVQVPWPHEGLHSTRTTRYLHNWSPGPLTSQRSTLHHHHHQVPAQQESRSLDLTKVYTAPAPPGTCTTGVQVPWPHKGLHCTTTTTRYLHNRSPGSLTSQRSTLHHHHHQVPAQQESRFLDLTKVYTAPPPPSGTCTTGVQVPWPHKGLHCTTTTIRYLHNRSPGPLTSQRSTLHHHHHQVPAQLESRSLDLTKVYTAPSPPGTCTTGVQVPWPHKGLHCTITTMYLHSWSPGPLTSQRSTLHHHHQVPAQPGSRSLDLTKVYTAPSPPCTCTTGVQVPWPHKGLHCTTTTIRYLHNRSPGPLTSQRSTLHHHHHQVPAQQESRSLDLTKVYTAPSPPPGTCTAGVQVPWPHKGLHCTITTRYLHNRGPGPLTSQRSTLHHHHHVPAQLESRSLDLTKVYTAPSPPGTCTTGVQVPWPHKGLHCTITTMYLHSWSPGPLTSQRSTLHHYHQVPAQPGSRSLDLTKVYTAPSPPCTCTAGVQVPWPHKGLHCTITTRYLHNRGPGPLTSQRSTLHHHHQVPAQLESRSLDLTKVCTTTTRYLHTDPSGHRLCPVVNIAAVSNILIRTRPDCPSDTLTVVYLYL